LNSPQRFSFGCINRLETKNYEFFPRNPSKYPQVIHRRERSSENTAPTIVINKMILINENFFVLHRAFSAAEIKNRNSCGELFFLDDEVR
jgi:hypothetical protein